MPTLFAKNYANRADLEAVALISDAGQATIEGTKAELERLHLSDQTTVHGVKCVITDTPTQINPQMDKPERGELHPHKII